MTWTQKPWKLPVMAAVCVEPHDRAITLRPRKKSTLMGSSEILAEDSGNNGTLMLHSVMSKTPMFATSPAETYNENRSARGQWGHTCITLHFQSQHQHERWMQPETWGTAECNTYKVNDALSSQSFYLRRCAICASLSPQAAMRRCAKTVYVAGKTHNNHNSSMHVLQPLIETFRIVHLVMFQFCCMGSNRI